MAHGPLDATAYPALHGDWDRRGRARGRKGGGRSFALEWLLTPNSRGQPRGTCTRTHHTEKQEARQKQSSPFCLCITLSFRPCARRLAPSDARSGVEADNIDTHTHSSRACPSCPNFGLVANVPPETQGRDAGKAEGTSKYVEPHTHSCFEGRPWRQHCPFVPNRISARPGRLCTCIQYIRGRKVATTLFTWLVRLRRWPLKHGQSPLASTLGGQSGVSELDQLAKSCNL